jgi:hypothetical protein
MKLSDKVGIPQHVLARQVGDESVMLDLEKGAYFGLDPVGARVWQLLAEGMTLAQACDRLLEEYEVSREDIERDVIALAEHLAANGLIHSA